MLRFMMKKQPQYRYVQASAQAIPKEDELWHGLVEARTEEESMCHVEQIIGDEVRFYNEYIFRLCETQEELHDELKGDEEVNVDSRSAVALRSMAKRYVEEGRAISHNRPPIFTQQPETPDIVRKLNKAKAKDVVPCSRKQMRELLLFCLLEGQLQMAQSAEKSRQSSEAHH